MALTWVAFLVFSQEGNVVGPRVIVATADTNLWYRNWRDDLDVALFFSFDDPLSSLTTQLRQHFYHSRASGRDLSLPILAEKPFRLSYPRATRLVGWVQGFSNQKGKWYLQFVRHDSKEPLEIGGFADRASAIAWAKTAASGLREGDTNTPMEGWYRVLPE